MVDASSCTGVNKAQLAATHDGQIIVPAYDWSTFLGQYFKKITNITNFHHFQFTKDKPGVVYCKESVSSPEQRFVLLKSRTVITPVAVLPPEIEPEGLSQERKNYLY